LVVSVRVTETALLSAALKVYVVVRLEALAKVPVPEVLHVEVVADPPLVPVTVIELVEEQTSTSIPALTVAGCPMVTVTTADSGLGQLVGATPKDLTV
jgi:hypothetical protein